MSILRNDLTSQVDSQLSVDVWSRYVPPPYGPVLARLSLRMRLPALIRKRFKVPS